MPVKPSIKDHQTVCRFMEHTSNCRRLEKGVANLWVAFIVQACAEVSGESDVVPF